MQGADKAPPLVRLCLERWQALHPGWDVTVHDRDSLHATVDLDWLDEREAVFGRTLTPLEVSDVARVELLATHGGVWADATVFPVVPLDDWLPPLATTGFFAFRRPGPDRHLSTWFLAADSSNPLIGAWRDAVRDYWTRHRFDRQDHPLARLGIGALARALPATPQQRQRLVGDRAAGLLRRHPYFWLHYTFGTLLDDDALRRAWHAVPTVSADDAHRVHRREPEPLDDDARRHVDERRSPVYKLSHRVDLDRLSPDTALHHLLRVHGLRPSPEPH